MSWSSDIVLEFLELYRREQHLWDPKHPLHRNRTENNDAWLRIQSSLSVNCSIVDLKKKKESLMTSFRTHVYKKKKSEDGYNPTWFAYPLMESFLGGKYECDNTIQLENEYFNDGDTSYNTQPTISEYNTNRNVTLSNKRQIKSARNHQSNSLKSREHSNNEYAKKHMDDAATYFKNASGEKRDNDECELYGQLLAKKLKKLDEHQRDIAMHEIDNIMFRAKMQSSSCQSRSYSASPSPVPRKIKSPLFIVAQSSNQQYEDENTTYQDPMQVPTSS